MNANDPTPTALDAPTSPETPSQDEVAAAKPVRRRRAAKPVEGVEADVSGGVEAATQAPA